MFVDVNAQDSKVVIPIHKPDLDEKVFFLISGVLASAPLTLFIDQFTNSLLNTLPLILATVISATVFAPLVEEFAKVFPLLYRHGEAQRSILILRFLVGLGFGIVEFLTYVVALDAPIPSRLPAVILHPMVTSITAYGIATKSAFWFYILAVSLHFSFNLSVLFYPFLPNLGAIAVLLLAFLLFWRFYNKTTEKFVT